MDYWTTAEAAERLGVTTTTVKRWADEGRLDHFRTAGGHRRFRPDDVRALQTDAHEEAPQTGEADTLTDLMLSSRGSPAIQAWLLDRWDRWRDWPSILATVGDAMTEMGLRWARGEIFVYEEHAASERLARALAAISEQLSIPPHAPVVALAVPDGEDHTLGLSLLQLLVAASGFRSLWLGRQIPSAELAHLVSSEIVATILLSASDRCADTKALEHYLSPIATACAARATLGFVGGGAAWPDPLPEGFRRASLQSLPGDLATLLRPSRR